MIQLPPRELRARIALANWCDIGVCHHVNRGDVRITLQGVLRELGDRFNLLWIKGGGGDVFPITARQVNDLDTNLRIIEVITVTPLTSPSMPGAFIFIY